MINEIERIAMSDSFLAVHDGWSADRVIADPELNSQYIYNCSMLIPGVAPVDCNRTLLNMRKAGKLVVRTTRRTLFENQEEYAFASEMAIRHLERRDTVSLDDVICDPVKAREFDQLASELAPGYSPLQYRWAALRLRKTSKLKPEPLGNVVRPEKLQRVNAKEMRIDDIPRLQGVYLIFCNDELLYTGEARDLRHRLRKHVHHSDNAELAKWFWANEGRDVFIEFYVLPESTDTRTRKAVELELIRSRKPSFNVQR